VSLFRRRETQRDDYARTGRLLEALENAYYERVGEVVADLDPFEEVVMEAVMPLPGDPYPPAGHTYPRRG